MGRGEGQRQQGRRRLPISVQTFREARESDCYYVDKTGYIERLVSGGKCYFLSRPRRFGKSLFLDTVKEAFECSRELFEGLAICDRWDWSAPRPVVRLDFSSGDGYADPNGLRIELADQLRMLETAAGVESGAVDGVGSLSGRLRRLIVELHRCTGRRVVVLVDEYDKPILDALRTPEAAEANRDLLRGVYSCVKFADAHIKFAFLTGVSKFSKVNLFSGLNNLVDITLDRRYSSICGYTDEDIDTVFAAELDGLDRDRIREWYNGYSWRGDERVYNPYDVLLLFDKREFRSYWFETGTPGFLVDMLIERGVSTLELGQMIVSERLLSAFDVGHMATEALLFQTGYLTITGEEQRGSRVLYRLDYPNMEVRESLNEVLLEQLVGPKAFKTVDTSDLDGILHTGDTQALRELFEGFFDAIPYQWHSSSKTAARYESYYATVFYAYFEALGADVRVEDTTSRGRIDMTALTAAHIWIFEFKIAESSAAGSGMAQILDRGYADKYRSRGVPIILVAIEFSRETRNIANYETITIQP